MVLHKNKWDKKASKLHEKKLTTKNKDAVAAEEKEKIEARALKNAESRVRITAASARAQNAGGASTSQQQPPQLDPTPGESIKPTQANESGSESGEDGEKKNFSRRRKEQSNAWRYEEPEPEPGQPAEESDHETQDHLLLAQAKIKAMAEKEAKAAAKKVQSAAFDPDDDEFINRMNKSRSAGGKGKGNVVKVSRDSFKDVTEKMQKQQAADDFRQRFGASKKRTPNQQDSEAKNDEDELDAIIGGLSIKGHDKNKATSARNGLSAETSGPPNNTTEIDSLDDDRWLDDRLTRK